MAFRTNIGTGEIPVTGIFGPGGEPSGINDNGQRVYSRTSSASNPSIGNYVESLSERIVDEGSWNPLTAEYSTLPFSAESGCWNVGNSSEASPYINTLKVDNAIQADSVMTFANGANPRPVTPGRPVPFQPPPCDCPPHWPLFTLPTPQWGIDEYFIDQMGGTCQPPRSEGLLNMRVFYFSGDHEGHSGIFAITPDARMGPFTQPPWYQELTLDRDLFNPFCYPPDALRTAINGGHYPGPNCAYKHLSVSYRGTGISAVGVSGKNWTGYCHSDYQFHFYESRIGGNCSGKPGYLYACDGEGFISELAPTYEFGIEDSCDCKARYDNGRWSSWAHYPKPPDGGGGKVWVRDAEPDWDASNDGALTDEIATKVYWTGSGCFNNDGYAIPVQEGLDKTKLFAIVATGGGGPGAGDNIPPYWSDTECDWMYAIREVVSGECNNLEYNPFICCTTTGCPTGPTIEIGLTKLYDASCSSHAYVRCPGVNWVCCLSGTGEAPGSSGYCTSIQNRGPLYPNGDYVCYADGTGNVPGASGPYWIVNSDSNWDGITGVACNWTYDLQYYNPYIPGPSGALQTGILESAISTGCA